jgi:hypothetical protein
MKAKGTDVLPKARKSDLVMEELRDEVLVYDLERHRAICLNETAAIVWRLCDGETTVVTATERIRARFNVAVDEEVVRLALDRLSRAHLLEYRPKQAFRGKGMSRRDVIRKLGLATAVALPLVTSIVAPSAASAASPLPAGACEKLSCSGCPQNDSIPCFVIKTGKIGACQCVDQGCKCQA